MLIKVKDFVLSSMKKVQRILHNIEKEPRVEEILEW